MKTDVDWCDMIWVPLRLITEVYDVIMFLTWGHSCLWYIQTVWDDTFLRNVSQKISELYTLHHRKKLELWQATILKNWISIKCIYCTSLKKAWAPFMAKNRRAISRRFPSMRFPIIWRIFISSSSSWVFSTAVVLENHELCFEAAFFAFILTSCALFFSIKSSSSSAYFPWIDLNQFKLQ